MRFPRSSGILLHLTSLPGPHGCGDLGPAAYHFVDWMVVAGQSLWQMLPLGPVGNANSPYMSHSAFAGNPLLVDLQELVRRGWLSEGEATSHPAFSDEKVNYAAVIPFRVGLLKKAAARFFETSTTQEREDFTSFCASEKGWLDDYALFEALHAANGGALWTSWSKELSRRVPSAIAQARKQYDADVRCNQFIQWCFARQWRSLKKYANDRGVRLVGDLPIFVSHHSSDVWSHAELFHLDEKGDPTVVAGVPPDYFSSTGQRWGNPLYRWDKMQAKRFGWWIDRFRASFESFDIVRIDHFRGFEAYWEIPASEKTAVKGRWVKAPGRSLFAALLKRIGRLPIIAEDLGLITPEVVDLRDGFGLPGMKVLQFAFAGGPDNAFLPHHHVPHCVVYTGTHDNDTTVGWYASSTEHEKEFARRYTNSNGHEIHWALINAALHSVADTAVVPFQDVLGLDSRHRMNFPGTTVGNWEWRFVWNMVQPHHAVKMYEASTLTSRCGTERLNLPTYPAHKAKP